MRLLIVNDEVLTADTMKEEVPWKRYGVDEVVTAYDAEAGKKWFSRLRIDLMLLDIEMPGENGLSLLRWVRDSGYQTPCIFLTCHASFAYAQEAISLGCQDYILIPATYEKIGEKVQAVIQRLLESRKAARFQEYGRAMLKQNMEEEAGGEPSPELLAEETADYIMANIRDETLSVNGIAEKFHFHPVYLNRIFKKEKHVSVSQFIINERMKLAAALLEDGIGAHEAAEKVGYAHYTNFYNMFKRYYGKTPSEYQKESCKS